MVEILVSKSGDIFFAFCVKSVRVIIFCLLGSPLVKGFIHYIDSHLVTGVKEVLSSRIMGKSNGIEPKFFQLPHLAFLRVFICACSKNSIVVMNTSTLEFHGPAIDFKPLFRAPCKGSDAEALYCLIYNRTVFLYDCLDRVEIWIFCTPKLRVRY